MSISNKTKIKKAPWKNKVKKIDLLYKTRLRDGVIAHPRRVPIEPVPESRPWFWANYTLIS